MTYIIAEAGVNHNGSVELAKKLALVAKQSGADVVKFQTFKADNLVTKHARQAAYQINNLGEATSQYAMLKKLELTYDEFASLKVYCDEIEIEFMSTPFDIESADFLIDKLDMKVIKIPSGELTNLPFLYEVALKRKKMIISTGMATVEEIHEALAYVAYGLAGKREMNTKTILDFYRSSEAKDIIKSYINILHCTTEYPASFDSINLKAMEQLKNIFHVDIGISDHSEGIAVPIAAVALGAKVVEKHFTLDKEMEGPDHVASLDPVQLSMMIKHIREIEICLGDGIKQPTPKEKLIRDVARKSIVAKRDIHEGELLTSDNLTVKRPGTGMPPSQYWDIIGKSASKNYQEDDLIDE